MPPERYPKPDLSAERAKQLGTDITSMKALLRQRLRWLHLEKSKQASSELRSAIETESKKIHHLLFQAQQQKGEFTEDEAIQFLHAADQILGTNKYGHTASVIDFRSNQK